MIPRFHEVENLVQAKDIIFRSAPLHWHTHYEIELTVTGNVRHIVNGQEFVTSPGFVSIMTPCDFHQYVDSGCESRLKKCYFTDSYISHDIMRLLLTTPLTRCTKLSTEDYARISPMFDELIEGHRDQTPIGSLYIRNLTERLCLFILDACEKSDEGAVNRTTEHDRTGLLNTALTYIAARFTGKITLEEVAAMVHLSPNYFSHFFSRSLGTTFSQYVKLKRIQYASVLLLTTDYAIDDIAYRAGFSSTSFFNNVFKKQYNLAPFAYRSRFRA